MVANQTFTVVGHGDEQVLNHSVQNATQIDVELERPNDIRLPSGTARVREIRLSVDDPTAFLDAVRKHMP